MNSFQAQNNKKSFFNFFIVIIYFNEQKKEEKFHQTKLCGFITLPIQQSLNIFLGKDITLVRKMRLRGNIVNRFVLWDHQFNLVLVTALVLFLFIKCGIVVNGLDISRRRGGITSTSYNRPNKYGKTSSKQKIKVSVAVVLPHTEWHRRRYIKEIKTAAESLQDMTFEESGFELFPALVMMDTQPSPTEVLGKICDQFLANNTSAVFYLTNDENYGAVSVASQYFIQLAQYVQIPIISWNADNSAYEQGTAESLQLQLAPTIKHQARAILSLLERYGWHTFSIVTGQIAGHRNFIQVRQ